MPALQFEQLPADQTDKIKKTLRAQWQIEANALNQSWFSDRGKFNTARAKLNAKYQTLEFDAFTKLQQQQQERQRVQQLIRQPRQRTREEEAGLRMELRPEAERLVFPPAPPALKQPFSAAALRPKGPVYELMNEYIDAVPRPGWWFTRAKKETRKLNDIVDSYKAFQDQVGYYNLPNIKQRQLDLLWDSLLQAQPGFDPWWKDKAKRQPVAEVRGLRAKGPISRIMAGKVTTPIGRSIGMQLPKQQQQPLTPDIARQILREAGNDKIKARQIARQRGYRF